MQTPFVSGMAKKQMLQTSDSQLFFSKKNSIFLQQGNRSPKPIVNHFFFVFTFFVVVYTVVSSALLIGERAKRARHY